jgi:hypothetical protein
MILSDNIYQAGNTIRLLCTFKDFNQANVDPDLVKVVIYDQKYNMLQTITTNIIKSSVGNYYYDYTIPEDSRQKLYYEFYGMIGGVPSLKRDSFKTIFA